MEKKQQEHDQRRPSSLVLVSPKSNLKPSFTFPGSGRPSFSYSATSTQESQNNVYRAGVQGKYSRYGSVPSNGRQRPSLTPTSVLDTRRPYQQANKRYRRHTMGSGVASSPLRSPPIPTRQSLVWPTSHQKSPSSPRGSITLTHSPMAEGLWGESLGTTSLTSPLRTLRQYSENLQDLEKGVPTQERMVNSKLQRVFTGADAIEWFMANMEGVTTVEKAQLTGNQLLKCGLIVNVGEPTNNRQNFLGSPNSLYQFPPMSIVKPSGGENNTMRDDQQQSKKGTQKEQSSRGRCVLL